MSSVCQLYRWAKAAYMPVCKDYPLLMPSNRTRTRCFGAKQSSVEKGWLFMFLLHSAMHFSIWLIQGCLLHGTQFVLNKKWQSPHVVYVFWWHLIDETQWFITPSVLCDWVKVRSAWVYKISSTILALSSSLVRELKQIVLLLRWSTQTHCMILPDNPGIQQTVTGWVQHFHFSPFNCLYVTLKTGLTTHMFCIVLLYQRFFWPFHMSGSHCMNSIDKHVVYTVQQKWFLSLSAPASVVSVSHQHQWVT